MQHLRWPPLPPVGQNRGKRKPGKPGSGKGDLPIQNAKKLPPELQECQLRHERELREAQVEQAFEEIFGEKPLF